MKKLAIIGSGDLGQQIAHYASTDGHYKVVGFFDDFRSMHEKICGYPVIGMTADVEKFFKLNYFDCLMIGIGYMHFTYRTFFFERFNTNIPFGKIIHSSCIVDNSAKVDDGSFIYPGCIIDRNVTIKNNVLIHVGSCIAHDTILQEHSYFSPRVAIAGFVNIGKCCNIGINTTVLDHISIGDNVQTGAGAVVIKNILEQGVYVGNPVKLLRKP